MALIDRQLLRILAKVSVVGLNIVISTFVGLGIGYYLDKWLGTRPWLTLVFLLLGVIAGFKDLARITKFVQEDDKNGPDK